MSSPSPLHPPPPTAHPPPSSSPAPRSPVSPVTSVVPSEALDYNFSSPEPCSPAGECGVDCSLEDASLRQDSRLPDSRLVKEKGVAVGHRHHGAAQLRSIVVKPASYRDVVVGKSYRRSWSNKAERSGRNYLLRTGAAGHALMRMALRRFVGSTGGAGGVVLSNQGWVRMLESQ